MTVLGTTMSVRYLRNWGYLRTASQVKRSIKYKKDDIKDRMEDQWVQAWRQFAKKKSR